MSESGKRPGSFGLLRIGGSLEDHINYDFESDQEHCQPFPMEKDPNDRIGFGKGCITKSKRAELITFAEKTDMKVIFGINALVGREKQSPYWNYTGKWDSSNAEQLLNEWTDQRFKV